MKTITKLFTFLFLAAPFLTFGQIYDKDSIFILERKALEFGKIITGKSKSELTGFTWRISTGYVNQQTGLDYYYNPAGATSLSLEFGFRSQFLEAGFRHFRTVSAFGVDHPYYTGSGVPGVVASYSIPTLSGLISNMGTATIHIPIKKVPLFINFGVGHSVFKFSDKNISQVFYGDGTSKYIYTPSTFFIPSKIKALTTTLGLGFSKGPFLAGLEWWQLLGKKDTFGTRYKNNLQVMYAGVQMNTSQTRKSRQIKHSETVKQKRVALGVNKLTFIAPFKKYSGTGTGWSADISVNIKKRGAILGSFQFKSNSHGYPKHIPDPSNPFEVYGNNPAGEIGRHLLYAGTLLNPKNAFQVYTYYGAGYYFSTRKDPDFIIDPIILPSGADLFERSGGVVMGTGIQYKYIHSQILLHKTFRSYKAILEWNLGGRMLF